MDLLASKSYKNVNNFANKMLNTKCKNIFCSFVRYVESLFFIFKIAFYSM